MEEARVLFGTSSHQTDKSRINPVTFLMTEAASDSKLGTVLAKMSGTCVVTREARNDNADVRKSSAGSGSPEGGTIVARPLPSR